MIVVLNFDFQAINTHRVYDFIPVHSKTNKILFFQSHLT